MSAISTLRALGYVGIASAHRQEWRSFATYLLGLEEVAIGPRASAFRLDDWAQRFVIEDADRESLVYLGWEVAGPSDLQALAARIETSGVQVTAGDAQLAKLRRVAELVVFEDPTGIRVEAFWGAERARTPFSPGRPLSGFRTGHLGLGHVVLHTAQVEPMRRFYQDVLGFKISDFGMKPYPVHFFHLNARHHSFALVGSGRHGLHHLMLELNSLDDVGQCHDLAELETQRVAYTLGRHTNDHMTSFYLQTPSDFFIEYGWGGRDIDPATWVPHETLHGPSFWGHDRLALSPELRAEFRALRLDAAAKGLRAD